MNFTYERIGEMLNRLWPYTVRGSRRLDGFEFAECGYKSANVPDAGLEFRPWRESDRFGQTEEYHAWFRGHIALGDAPDGCERYLENYYGDGRNPQYIVYIDGKMTSGTDRNHTRVPLPRDAGEHDVMMYVDTIYECGEYRFEPRVVDVDTETESLWYDIEVPYDAIALFDRNSLEYVRIRDTLDGALNVLDWRAPGSREFYASVKNARTYLKENLYDKLPTPGAGIPNVACVGHTHIDTAWLWTFAETREKVQRTFSTVVEMMKKYPEYKFMSSQPQLYTYLKEDAPETYAEIKRLVGEGRWEPEGAMWVEADCNLTGGEALVRQILYGKRFFRDEFDRESHILWLPDVFGYSAALPQILKKSGVDTFVTSKISWNETNRMPYDVFDWRGIDGSEVFTYFLTPQKSTSTTDPIHTNTTYNGDITPSMIMGTWRRMQQKECMEEALDTYGYGDGGGGPTTGMIERGRRMTRSIGGLPTVSFEFAGDFLDRVRRSTAGKLPRWVGELYLEFHRGTYTSNAKNKKNNRKSEFAYMDAESAAVTDMTLFGGEYPREMIDRGWRDILLCQFHDVLPGSSIGPVYDDTDKIYARILEDADVYTSSARARIARSLKKADGKALVFNPNGFTASGVVKLGGETVYVRDIPAHGYAVADVERGHKGARYDEASRTLENGLIRVTFNDKFELESVYDKHARREVLSGAGNALVAYEDFPRAYDAWEITNYYKEKSYPIDDVESAEPFCDGIRVGVRVTRRYMNSTVTQTVTLTPYSKRIDFETHIDWHERHTLVKARFPVNVNASRATYEIQYGHVERTTHENTSWDAAQFEVCAHKYADVSEYGYGAAILNDCKYGYSCESSTLSLTLLKCATHPNREADQGVHDFTYSFLPHEGDFRAAGVIKESYLLNRPLAAFELSGTDDTIPASFSLADVDSESGGVIVESVKAAENDEGDVIIRMYDSFGTSTRARVSFGFDVESVRVCDLMENEISPLTVTDCAVSVDIGAFEILTLRARRK